MLESNAANYRGCPAKYVDSVAASLTADERGRWVELLLHALSATSSRPSARWLKGAGTHLEAVTATAAAGRIEIALAQFDGVGPERASGRATVSEPDSNVVRGLLWMVPLLPPSASLTRAVAAVALAAFKKLPGVGPRAVKVGNAAIYALSEMSTPDAIGQLAVLKSRIKFGSAQKELEKAFAKVAEKTALDRGAIEELAVPTYGLDVAGKRRVLLGEHAAEIVVAGGEATLTWTGPQGKPLKSTPAKVKAEHADALQELKQALKDVQAMLLAQRDRLDGLFLKQANWPLTVWRDRYLDHPLIGTLTRQLIWCVDQTPVLYWDGEPRDAAGRSIAHGRTAEFTLWHPAGRPIDEVLAWRTRLENLGIRQPFKQAHREVYLLTDAERSTQTYSNRFAAHILRQHQFHALCAARGWKNRLRLLVDDALEPPCKLLPEWGLRAEFWVEGVGNDFGIDINDSGVFLRIATDQVRFYRLAAAPNVAHAAGGGYAMYAPRGDNAGLNEPLPLKAVPPLVFSEIMRDVDLFVGVASVGNDPTWHDGGPEGRFLDYWQSFSFGELSGTAATRKQVLERLIPRLKIADRCSFSDRFLVVRGDLRTYKLHLGSGNILMEPNDQYLCIVPDARSRAAQGDLYLPFDGDSTLSIILSKALLLAEDRKIKDPTIVRQLELR